MRLYETVFILKPDLTEEETQSWIQRILEVLEKNKGELVRLDEWGLTKLAYRIRKFQKGYYVYAVFLADYPCVKELDRHFKMLEPFLRHIIVKLDDRELENHRQAQQANENKAREQAQSEAAQEFQEVPEPAEEKEAEPDTSPEETAAVEETTEEKPAEEVTT